MSTVKAKQKKKVRKNIQTGVAHISATFNNTIVSITDVWATSSRGRASGTCGFKGSRKSTPFAAQLAAEDAAKKAMEHGVRNVTVYVNGPGSGRESALRALNAAGLQDQPHPRRDAGAAQRLPSAQASPRLITSKDTEDHGSLYWCSLSALPARRHEALPQGRALLHRQVRLRASLAIRRVSTARTAAASARTTASSCARSRRSSASTASRSASSAATTTRRCARRASPVTR